MLRSSLFAAALLAGFVFTAAAGDVPGLRVVTWNIHHGEGVDGKLDLPRLADFLRTQSPDVVLLQEVDVNTTRTGGVDQAAELGRLLGMTATFGKAMPYAGGEYGNAILTRETPLSSHTWPLPGGGEPRAALEVVIPDRAGHFGGEAVTVVSTHLDVSVKSAREAHGKELAERFGARPGPVIFGGDFNCTRDDAPVQAFAAPWVNPPKPAGHTLTCPVPEPRNEIDFILLKPGKTPLTARDVRVLAETTASDHYPVLTVVSPASALPE